MRARAHPLHTTYSELTISRDGRSARALIRVFADDFSATVVKTFPAARRSPSDFERAAYTYIARHFRLTDRRGVPYALRWCGLRKNANFMWLCVGSDHLSAGDRPQLTNGLLDDVFTDQINIVRVSADGRTSHILFARGDGPKQIR